MKKLLFILSLLVTTSAFAGDERVLQDNLKNSMQAQFYDMIKNVKYSCKQVMGYNLKLSQSDINAAVERKALEVLSSKLDSFEYIDSKDQTSFIHFSMKTRDEIYESSRRVFNSTVYVPLNGSSKINTFNFNHRQTYYNGSDGKVQSDEFTFRAECTFSK